MVKHVQIGHLLQSHAFMKHSLDIMDINCNIYNYDGYPKYSMLTYDAKGYYWFDSYEATKLYELAHQRKMFIVRLRLGYHIDKGNALEMNIIKVKSRTITVRFL